MTTNEEPVPNSLRNALIGAAVCVALLIAGVLLIDQPKPDTQLSTTGVVIGTSAQERIYSITAPADSPGAAELGTGDASTSGW